MNNTNSSTEADDKEFSPIMIGFITLQQIVFVIACLGNGLVIFMFIHKLKLKSNTNKFVVSLAVADFLTGIAAGSQLFYFLFPGITLNMISCFLRYQIVSYTTIVSQVTVTFTTFDRFIAICHPHRYSSIMTKQMATILCIIPWISALIFTCSPFFRWNVWEPGMPCIYTLLFHRSYYLITAIMMYLFSFTSFVMYLFILRIAWRYYSRVKHAVTDNQVKQKTNKSKTMEKDMRGAKVMGVVTLTFTVCWLPYMAFPFRAGIGINDISRTSITVSNWLVFLGIFNSIVNPFIYTWKRRDFNRECRKTFCRFRSVHDVTHASVISEM